MKVLVFGATGRVGGSVVEFALADGHTITAFVRDPAKITRTHDALTLVKGDIYKPETIASAMQGGGFDAVINTVGADPLKPSSVVADSARALVPVMVQAGITRYLGISGTAEMPKTPFGALTSGVTRRTPVGNAVRDHDRAYRIVTTSVLDWTLAGCPYIKDGAHTGRYTLSPRFPGGFKTISPQDVADFLVRDLADHRYSHQIIGIWY